MWLQNVLLLKLQSPPTVFRQAASSPELNITLLRSPGCSMAAWVSLPLDWKWQRICLAIDLEVTDSYFHYYNDQPIPLILDISCFHFSFRCQENYGILRGITVGLFILLARTMWPSWYTRWAASKTPHPCLHSHYSPPCNHRCHPSYHLHYHRKFLMV